MNVGIFSRIRLAGQIMSIKQRVMFVCLELVASSIDGDGCRAPHKTMTLYQLG